MLQIPSVIFLPATEFEEFSPSDSLSDNLSQLS